jgi:hypothetical protein
MIDSAVDEDALGYVECCKGYGELEGALVDGMKRMECGRRQNM